MKKNWGPGYEFCVECKKIEGTHWAFGLCRNCYLRQDYRKKKKQYVRRVLKAHLKKKFGITLEDRDELIKNQENRCLICKKTPNKEYKWWAIDHDHKTNKIRGMLCSRCNTGLGLFFDNISFLQSAIEYLKNSEKILPEIQRTVPISPTGGVPFPISEKLFKPS